MSFLHIIHACISLSFPLLSPFSCFFFFSCFFLLFFSSLAFSIWIIIPSAGMETGSPSGPFHLLPPFTVTAGSKDYFTPEHLSTSLSFEIYSSPRWAAGGQKRKGENQEERYTKRDSEGQIMISFSTCIHLQFLYIPFNFRSFFFFLCLAFRFASFWALEKVEDEGHGFVEIIDDLTGGMSLPLYSTPPQQQEQRTALSDWLLLALFVPITCLLPACLLVAAAASSLRSFWFPWSLFSRLNLPYTFWLFPHIVTTDCSI